MREYELIKARKLGLNLEKYDRPEFDVQQLAEIRRGLEAGVNVEIYAKPEFNAYTMHTILRGLIDGIDENIDFSKFNALQIDLIVDGFIEGLNIYYYAFPHFRHQQMKVLMEILRDGDDEINDIARPIYPPSLMKGLHLYKDKQEELLDYFNDDYNEEQISGILYSYSIDVDVKPYMNLDLGYFNIVSMSDALGKGYNPEMFTNPLYGSAELEVLMEACDRGYDLEVLAKPDMTLNEMLACMNILEFMKENGIKDFEEGYIKFDAGYLHGIDFC